MKLIKDMLYIYSAYVYLCFTPKKLYQQRIKDYGFLSPLSANKNFPSYSLSNVLWKICP